MERFEYKTLLTDAKGFWGGEVDAVAFQNQLNELGAEGWELVNSVSTAQAQETTRWIVSILKRRL